MHVALRRADNCVAQQSPGEFDPLFRGKSSCRTRAIMSVGSCQWAVRSTQDQVRSAERVVRYAESILLPSLG
jgi:hypothetical protein